VPCCTEVERWDWVNEQANLWIKVPTIVSGTDTKLYLYYDKTHSDNTHYIGDTGDEAAQNVWDGNFIGVWHLAQDPSGGSAAIKDSTSSNNNGTPGGTMIIDDLVNGKVGKALNFDGGDDYVSGTGNDESSYSISAIMKRNGAPGAWEGMASFSDSSSNRGEIAIDSSGYPTMVYTTSYKIATSVTVIDNQYHHVYGMYDGATAKLYVDGQSVVLGTPSAAGAPTAVSVLRIGDMTSYGYYFAGIIDEVRISNTGRSDAWVKAEYYSSWNDFVTFDAETHFIVAFDDDAGEEFNALILDKVSIKGTV
jgi:hypothetical protein